MFWLSALVGKVTLKQMPVQNIDISEQQAAFIRQIILDGQYANADEVVRAGLELLAFQTGQDKRKLESLRHLVNEGWDSLDHEDYEVVADESLSDLMHRVSAVTRRSESEKAR